jgi:hypothetical protein
MSGISKLLLPVVLISWLLAGCAYEGASYSPSLGFNANAGANSSFEPSTEMTPYPAPGYDYYSDNWYDTGNGRDHGQFSNW